jgi:hypothetical protein
MMQSLQGLLTESRLDQAMKDAKEGKYDELDLDGELLVADAIVAEAKATEEAAAKAAADAVWKAALGLEGLKDEMPNEVIEDKVEEALVEAEKTATEEEKKTGFWVRIGGFFKGLFTSKKVEG